ncbi:MAG: DUF1540 domain-containing protein [Thioalkalispiraceae bacterium]
MKMTIDIPLVSTCEVSECAYNIEQNCHACAITIGDGVHPGCDTYFSNDMHTNSITHIAGVGACKVTACRYNDDLECGADSISVGHDKSGIRCMTYVQD